MRKILFALVIIVLLIFAGSIIYKGTNFAGFDVWGVTQISDKNNEIDEQNEKLTKLVDQTYPAALSTLATSSETLQKTKKEYEDQAVLLSDSKYYKQTEKYKVEFLWTKIGNYAKDNNVTVDLKFKNSIASGLYEMDIVTVGKYPDVTQFIYDIENDSKLGFKIEDFSMKSATISTDSEGKSTSSGVQGTFTCKEIRIDMKSLDGSSTNSASSTTKNTSTNKDEVTTDSTGKDENTTDLTNSTNTVTNKTNTVETEEVQRVENTNEVNESTP